jgi:hypothetical protein
LHSEAMAQGTPDPVQFEITSIYVPSQPSAEPAKTAQTMAKSGGAQ